MIMVLNCRQTYQGKLNNDFEIKSNVLLIQSGSFKSDDLESGSVH